MPRNQSSPIADESSRATTLLKSLQVLDALAALDRRGGVTLQQIADHVGQSKSSVHRWLQAFREHGLVDQNPRTESYRLGLKVLELSSRLLANLDLRAEAAPILHDLMERSGETVHMSVYDRGEVICVEKLDGPGSVLMRSRVGGRTLAYCTGVGKALLAYQPVAEVESVLAGGLAPRTPNTIVDPVALVRHLEEIRLRGYSVDNEENEPDIRCVAAPVFDHSGRSVAAISVAGLASRMTDDRVTQLSLLVRRAAESISARMGYQSVPLSRGALSSDPGRQSASARS